MDNQTRAQGQFSSNGNGDHHPTDVSLDNVTREQGGQFIDEGLMLFRGAPGDDLLDAPGDAQLIDRDAGSVSALQVNLERAGADYIQAQKSFLTNSGAQTISTESARLTQSGVVTLNSGQTEFKQSTALIANVGDLSLDQSSVLFASAERASMAQSSAIALQARHVEAEGDIRTFALFGGSVRAGGDIHTTVDSRSAAVFGVVFAGALAVLGKLFGKKSS